MRRPLTPRQTQVLLLFALDWTHVRIGRHLDISPETVRTHAADAMRRLGVHSKAAAVWVAHNEGVFRR